MTSKEIIRKASEQSGITQKALKKAIDALEIACKEILSNGEYNNIKLADIKFTISNTVPHRAYNIRTKEIVMLDSYKTLKLTKSSDYKKIFK